MSEEDKMDVDTSGAAAGAAATADQEKTIKCHPLALIAITDHQTRVLTGGSALPPGAPVVGLLFGHQDGLTVSILDAIEMEHSFASAAGSSSSGSSGEVEFGGGTEAEQAQHKAALKTKIELHRKVFPTHEVVGWYKVTTGGDGSDEEGGGPTEQDLRTNNGKMKDLNESPLFLLMNSGSNSGGDSSKKKKAAASDDSKQEASDGKQDGSAGQTAREKLDRDEQLPVSIYESLVTVDQATIFVNLEFELETFEPERIAVENVFKAQRQVVATTAAAASSAAADNDTKMPSAEDAKKDPAGALATLFKSKASGAAGDGDAAGDVSKQQKQQQQPLAPPSELDAHFHTMQSSIESMNDRISVLLDYLRGVESGAIPNPDPGLLRQVDALVRRLPLLQTGQSRGLPREFEAEYDNAVMLAYLAALTKTARAVRVATDKTMMVMEAGNKDSLRRVM